MTDEAPHVHDLVAAYVLGAVTALEQERVESHLTRCAMCRDQERALREVAVLLPALVSEMAPPPALKTRLMGIVEAEAGAAGARPRGPRRGPPVARPMALGVVAAVAAAAALVALVVSGVGLWRTWGGAPSVPVTQVAIAGTTTQPAIRGSLRSAAGGGHLALDLHGLKPLPVGRVYELWLIRGHYRVVRSVGTFRPTRTGTARLTMGSDNVAHYTLTCLTVERAPGARQPTQPLVAVGAITG